MDPTSSTDRSLNRIRLRTAPLHRRKVLQGYVHVSSIIDVHDAGSIPAAVSEPGA
jgi:hypothetical protein